MRGTRASAATATLLIVAIVADSSFAADRPQFGPIDASQVLNAIDRGVAYLKREQSARGRWNEMVGYDGGVTALCTLSLLNSGVPVDDPVVARSLTYLRSMEPDKTYVVALQTMVLCAAEPKKDMVTIERNVRWLESHQINEADHDGAWSYPGPGGDNSNSQFAVLALYDAQCAGATVSRLTWQRAAAYWRKTQNDDGSWGYVPGEAGSGSMTCAGIGGLAICTAALESGDAAVENGRVDCCRPHQPDDALDRGINWLAQHFSVTRNPRPAGIGQACIYYYLYGLERCRSTHGSPLHRRPRLVSRGGRVSGSRTGFTRPLLARHMARRSRSAHQHRAGATVSLQGAAAGRDGQAAIRRPRPVESASQRRRASGRLYRAGLAFGPHVAGRRSDQSVGRRFASIAGALYQR